MTAKNNPQSASASFFNPFPKYLQVRHILARRMGSEYQPGDRLPTEQALCEEFGVSRETVREALRGLEHEGIIERHRAKGTFLKKRPDTSISKRLTGMVEDFTTLHLDTRAKVLDSMAVSAEREAPMLQTGESEVYKITRLRYFEGQPLAVHHAFLPIGIGEKIIEFDLENAPISEIIENELHIACVDERQFIEAIIADTEFAQLLDIPVGAPVLLVTRLCRLGQRPASVLFKSYFRADRYYYTLNLTTTAKRGDSRAADVKAAPGRQARTGPG